MLRIAIPERSFLGIYRARGNSSAFRLASRLSFHTSLTSRASTKDDSKSGFPVKNEEKLAEKQLEENPHFHKLAEDFNSHDHVHLRQSETEENDSLSLGSMAHRRAQNKTAHHPGHSHSHVGLNPLLTMNKNQWKQNPGVRITWIGLAINVGLALGKFAGGLTFHSQALIADAVHAVSDMVSDLLTLLSVGLAGNKSTKDYPFGYGKIETVGSLAVSTILTTAGLSIGWSSLCAIVGPIVPQTLLETFAHFVGHSHGHSHSVAQDVTNVNAAWIAAGSIVVKEWIFQATKKIAIASNSNVLMANAWHHRVDSLTSLVALVTITSGHFFGIQSLDAVGGLIVSGLVIKAGGEGMVTAVKELCDQSLSEKDERYLEVRDAMKEVLSKTVSNNNSGRPYRIKHLTILPSGPNLLAIATLEVPLQKWDNVLGIKEFEVVTDHLRCVLYKNLPQLKSVTVEFVEEQEPLSQEEIDAMAKETVQIPELEHKSEGTSPRHTHSHFGMGAGHTHKH
ncbi:related to Mitochondrial metal transporter 1 [Zygosaccharomyces bailii ISA1307]|nr:related to Mitochondrial metal transporter 1 [Zygosaccharomyces bailii ISA1307]